jgi:hypothetical protein
VLIPYYRESPPIITTTLVFLSIVHFISKLLTSFEGVNGCGAGSGHRHYPDLPGATVKNKDS